MPLRVDTAEHHESASSTRSGGTTRAARGWSLAVALLLLVTSAAGLLLDDPYAADPATAAMLRAYDLVTLAVVVPALALTPRWARARSVFVRLVPAGLLAAVGYSYCYHLLATPLHDLFLLHAAVVGGSAVALIVYLATLVTLSAPVVGPGGRGADRVAALALGVLSMSLAGLWVFVALDHAITGAMPAGSALVESDAVVRLGMALDLALLVPLYGGAAVLLWRRAPWGYALGVIAVVSGLLHQLGYVVAMPMQVAADVAGAVAWDPLEPVIILLYAVAAWSLLRSRRPSDVRRER